MPRSLITTSPESSVSDARALMGQHRIRHLLVTEEDGEFLGLVTDRNVMTSGRLVGIVTETDLLRAFVGAFTRPIG
jgi:CBS domain-containing protein